MHKSRLQNNVYCGGYYCCCCVVAFILKKYIILRLEVKSGTRVRLRRWEDDFKSSLVLREPKGFQQNRDCKVPED